MSDSILVSIKKVLGVDEAYTAFDVDILMHINSTFSALQQMGVGPDEGFSIVDDTAIWTDYTWEEESMNMVKSYIYLRVRKLFDPPGTSFLLEALNSQLKEYEWRLNVDREATKWLPPLLVVDGGDAVPEV